MDNLLDTNIVSQWTKIAPDARVIAWLSQLQPTELYLSAVTFSEVRFGIEEMPSGRKRRNFETWLEHDLRQGFAGRILAVDDRIAEEAGRLTSITKKAGAKPELADALIAATAIVHGMRLATLNFSHFKHFNLDLVKF